MKITIEKKTELLDRWSQVMTEILNISEEMGYAHLGNKALDLSSNFHNKINKLCHIKAKSIEKVIIETDDDSGEDTDGYGEEGEEL